MIFLIIPAGLLVLLCLIILSLNLYINQYHLDKRIRNKEIKKIRSVLYIVAHPDDEVMIAGTVAKLVNSGVEVHALYLTHGEDGPTGGLTAKENLGTFRMRELESVSKILKLASLEVLDFPDRYLDESDTDELRHAVNRAVEKTSPQIIISFDNLIGLYGSNDHITAGRIAREAAFSNDNGVEQFWQMTLSDQMKELAMKISKTFRERFDRKRNLPRPNMGVAIAAFSGIKMRVIKAHKTQRQVMRELQPLHHIIPAPVYFRIFSREYFHIEDTRQS